MGKQSAFDKVSNSVAQGYEKKGVKPGRANEIGDAVAAKIGREKLGQAEMTRRSVAGRKGK